MIKVCLVERYSLIADGITYLIHSSDDFKVFSIISDYNDCYSIFKDPFMRPDIILFDLDGFELQDFETLYYFLFHNYKMKMIVLMSFDQMSFLTRLSSLRIDGIICKECKTIDFLSIMRSIYFGEVYYDPILIPFLNSLSVSNHFSDSIISSLTKREKQIIGYVGKGFSNHEIADTLSLSESTIKNHLSNIFKKVGCSDRTQLSIFALRYL